MNRLALDEPHTPPDTQLQPGRRPRCSSQSRTKPIPHQTKPLGTGRCANKERYQSKHLKKRDLATI